MCIRVRRRCCCWQLLGALAGTGFAVFEREGFLAPPPAEPDPALHVTLSRVLARIPGAPGWIAAGGAVLAIHIRQVQKESLQ